MLNPPPRRETRFLPERDGPNEDAEGSFRGAGSEGFADRADGNARPSQAKPSHGDKARSTDPGWEVACRLALESLPRLPAETQEALREPIETLCEVSGRELERLKPGLLDRGAGSS